MLVKERMTKKPVTIRPNTPVTEAQALMKREKIHHLPVLDKNEKLVGVVSEKDLLYASPSPATTLSVFEMSSLLAKLTVDTVMSRKLITATEDVPIEEAARMMADNAIGSLPILRDGRLVGIITESDLFRMFIELFGARTKGVRVSLTLPDVKGELAKITAAISQAGGNIVALGTFNGPDALSTLVTVKVSGIARQELVALLAPLARTMEDVRDV